MVNKLGEIFKLTEHNQTYKSFDQMTPPELQQEHVLHRQGLRRHRISRLARIPKWAILLIIGLPSAAWLGVYCYEWINVHGFSFSTLWQLFQNIMDTYHPIAIAIGTGTYISVFFLLPGTVILNLMFDNDHVTNDFYASLRTIETLLAKRR